VKFAAGRTGRSRPAASRRSRPTNVCVANLDTSLERRTHAETADEILPEFPERA